MHNDPVGLEAAEAFAGEAEPGPVAPYGHSESVHDPHEVVAVLFDVPGQSTQVPLLSTRSPPSAYRGPADQEIVLAA